MCVTCIETKKCIHCHEDWRETEYRLSSGHVSALFKLRDAVLHYGRNSIHIQREMHAVAETCPFKLSDSEHSNFSYLRIHGLAIPDQNRPSGHWLLTTRGAEFLKGDLPIPQTAFARNGHPVRHEGAMVTVHEYRTKIPKSFYEMPAVEPSKVAQRSLAL